MKRPILALLLLISSCLSSLAASMPQRGFVQEFDSVVAILASSPTQLTTTYSAKGLFAINDGLGGRFDYRAGDTTATNATDCFAWGSGRLRRAYDGITASRIFVSGGSSNYIDKLTVDKLTLDPRNFGADPSGASDSTAAFQACFAYAQQNTNDIAQSPVTIPAGNFLITDTILITNNQVNVKGVGVWATRITFNPTSAKSLFKLDRGTAVSFQSSFEDMAIIGAGAFAKTAFELVDQSRTTLRNIDIHYFDEPGSIGILTKGREYLLTDNCTVYAYSPYVFDANPNSLYIGGDIYNIQNGLVVPTNGSTNYGFTIKDGCTISALNIWHTCVALGGGFLWRDDTNSLGICQGVFIGGNSRHEQAQVPSNYSIFWNAATNFCYNFTIENFQFPVAANGMYARRIIFLTLKDTFSSLYDTNREHLNFDGGVSTNFLLGPVVMDNTFWQVGPTATLTNLVKVSQRGRNFAQLSALPEDARYVPLSWGGYQLVGPDNARIGSFTNALGTFLYSPEMIRFTELFTSTTTNRIWTWPDRTGPSIYTSNPNGHDLRMHMPGGEFNVYNGSDLTFYTIHDSGNPYFHVNELGVLTNKASITAGTSVGTGNPSGGTAAPWKLGSLVTGASVSLVTTNYIQIDINGTPYKLGIVQ